MTDKRVQHKRHSFVGRFVNLSLCVPGMDPSTGQERRTPVTPSSSSRYHRRRSSGSRDERYRSGKRHTWGGRVLDDTPVGHLVSGPAVCRSHRPGELRVINTEVTSLTTRGAITSDTRAHLYVN